MVDALIDTLELFPRGLVYVGLAIVVLAIARVVQGFVTPYSIVEQLNQKNNVALALSVTGYYLGIMGVFIGALYEPFGLIADGTLGFSPEYWSEVLGVFLYSLGGIVVLNIARIVVDKLMLYQFDVAKEIVEEHNAGTGAVEFGVYIAVSLVIAGSISGEGGGPLTSLVFLVLGLVVLILFTLFYELTTSFDIHDEIEKNNTAVGVALAANTIAIGIVTMKAVFGDFVGWTEGLIAFVVFAIIGFVVLLVVRLIFDFILHPRVNVAEQLTVNQNLGFAFLEGGVVIGVSLILFFAI